MSAIGKLIGDTGSIGKNVSNIVLVVIVLFVAKHFLSDFGLKLYKMYYGIEGMTTAGAAGDYKMVTQGRGGGNLLTESECKSYAEANKYGYGINNNNPIGCIKSGGEVRFSSGSKNYKCSSANVCVEKPFIDGYKLVNSGKPSMNISEEECKNLTNKLQGYTFSKISEQGNPNGCVLQNGAPPGVKGIYYNSAGTADCGAFDGVSQCIEKTAAPAAKGTLSTADACKTYADAHPKYSWQSDGSWGDRPYGCVRYIPDGRIFFNKNTGTTAGTDYTANVWDIIVKDTGKDALPAVTSTPAAAAPDGYTYTGDSQCKDWNNNYVACRTPLDGTHCSIKATTLDQCASECNKRDSCGEMYFKDGFCYLANGKCVPEANPTNPQPHYKKMPAAAAPAAAPTAATPAAPAAATPAAPAAAQGPQEAEAKVADAATQASQMHSDAQDATNETSVTPGAAIGSWGDNKDMGVPDGSVAAQAASSNLATQQIIPGTAYPSNTTVANVSGVYPTQASLNNIQGGNVPQSMAGVNTEMAPSPLAPTSSEVASKANDAISRNIRGRDEEDAAIDISINMKMSEHVAKNLVGSVPQYTVPQQYATGRTTGLDNNTYNPSYQAMPQESLGTTYDNRLGGNYPTYSYNTQNNTGTAYTNQYKPVNPDKKPTPYNSLMDLFR